MVKMEFPPKNEMAPSPFWELPFCILCQKSVKTNEPIPKTKTGNRDIIKTKENPKKQIKKIIFRSFFMPF